MHHDNVPFLTSAVVTSALPSLPGPSKDEWAGAAFGLVALLIREAIWWWRNRKR